jgi:prepilin-type N-terminal cleavage/methylation domain-containing protein/prepilin-type processing-associated H-X9-DG protein
MRNPTSRVYFAFTLVELLVVIAIISFLVALTLPSLRNAREVALQARCGIQLKQAGTVMMTYAYDHKEWAPSMTIFARPTTYFEPQTNWVNYYFPSDKSLLCPTDAPFGNQKVIGGMKWKSAIFSSYVLLFGIGNALNLEWIPGNDDVDMWYGWRFESGTFATVPRLSLMGRTSTYTNPYRKLTRSYTLLTPTEQALAADTWAPLTAANTGTIRTFAGAGPGSLDTPATLHRPIMHRNSDGLNILYGDGHVTWKRQDQVIFRTGMGSGGPPVYW